jgi:tRNA pseudouridine38-40 synthase
LRNYTYRIVDKAATQSALLYRYSHFSDQVLDCEIMNQVSQNFLGLQDFSTFIKARPQSSNIRKLLKFEWVRDPTSGIIDVNLAADAFGHNMVRSLIRSVVLVGSGKKNPEWLLNHFALRKRVGETGPIEAKGLTLMSIDYPKDLAGIIAQNQLTQQKRVLE